MNTIVSRVPLLACLFAVVFLLGSAITTQAQPYTFDDTCNIGGAPPCCDDTRSLGGYAIWIHPRFRPLMTGYPGYDPVLGILWSPVLFDPHTIIGRSGPHFESDATDNGGATVGCDPPITLADSDIVHPTGWEGSSALGREIHVAIFEMNMCWYIGGTPQLPCVHAGHQIVGMPQCPGEVESRDPTGNPLLDFAPYPPGGRGFFDVWAEVEIPAAGQLTSNLLLSNDPQAPYNDPPLLVVNQAMNKLPPTTFYIHGITNAVRVRAQNDNPPQWSQGDLFGFLIISGHGVDISFDCEVFPEECNCLETGDPVICDFEACFHDNDPDTGCMPAMPVPGACIFHDGTCVEDNEQACLDAGGKFIGEGTFCTEEIPAVTEWGLLVMALLGLIAGTIMFRKARAVAA